MWIKLLRSYFPSGTNGEIWVDDQLLCYSIELPWRDNNRNISCIPEGEYSLSKRYSKKFGWHVMVHDVPERSNILFHAANDALKELQGCIAPVSEITGPGKGILSKRAFELLRGKVYSALENGQNVWLDVKRKRDDEYCEESESSDA